MLLHHDQRGPYPGIFTLNGKGLARLNGKGRPRLFDVENLKGISLGFFADVTPHDRSRHVRSTASSRARTSGPVEIEYSVGSHLVTGETLAKRIVVEPAHARAVSPHQAKLGKYERTGADPDQPNGLCRRLLQEGGCLDDPLFSRPPTTTI